MINDLLSPEPTGALRLSVAGLYGLGITAGLPLFLRQTSAALAAERFSATRKSTPIASWLSSSFPAATTGSTPSSPRQRRLLQEPADVGIPEKEVLKINDEVGFHPGSSVWSVCTKTARLAIVQGCSYPNPNLSHFTAMEYWHTGVPNGADARGWIGRVADAESPTPRRDYIVNIAKEQSLAVRSKVHAPLVFTDPEKFTRKMTDEQKDDDGRLDQGQAHVQQVARTVAPRGGQRRRQLGAGERGVRKYRRRRITGRAAAEHVVADLIKVAALIHAKMPTRIYYTSFGGFDTHANQAGTHKLLLIYLGDTLRGFLADMERIGRADDVALS